MIPPTIRTTVLLVAALVTASCTSVASHSASTQGAPGEPEPGRTEETPWNKRLVNPISQFTIFESPVINSELRPTFISQEFPRTSIFGGGDMQLYAIQARFAVTDRLAIIATKDGYIDENPQNGNGHDGFADIAGGVKYAIFEDVDEGIIVTPGIIFETDSGNHDVWQGNGDGLFRFFASAGWDLDEWNLLGTFGYNQPLDTDEESTSIDYHLHVDYEVTDQFFPLFEVNGITWVSSGNRLPVNFEGGDLINLGAADVSGQTVFTGAVGMRFRPMESLEFGTAYEFPMSNRKDLLKNRVMIDLIWTF